MVGRFEQCQVVEKSCQMRLPEKKRLQSLSTAESPKQDRCRRLSAKHSDVAAIAQRGARAESLRGCGEESSKRSLR